MTPSPKHPPTPTPTPTLPRLSKIPHTNERQFFSPFLQEDEWLERVDRVFGVWPSFLPCVEETARVKLQLFEVWMMFNSGMEAKLMYMKINAEIKGVL